MVPSPLSDIGFDQQDGNLFLVENASLRADALKHSVLPRLTVVMNSAIAMVRDIYGIEALEDSIISRYPNFRPRRLNELKVKYDDAFVGLGGQRRAKWPGFRRADGKPVQILPFRFAFSLSSFGVRIRLDNGWLKGLDEASFHALLEFHIRNEQKINPLCFQAHVRPDPVWAQDLLVLAPLRQQYRYRMACGWYDNHFSGSEYEFPVSGRRLAELVTQFATFFPVYDSYVQMAKGFPPRLDSLIAKMSKWIQLSEESSEGELRKHKPESRRKACAKAAIAAESKIRVMPGLRWQVFTRDGWMCRSCGKNASAGAILQVDHILPRSRGGANALNNYQTLCSVCNFGKSNRDATDLRSSR